MLLFRMYAPYIIILDCSVCEGETVAECDSVADAFAEVTSGIDVIGGWVSTEVVELLCISKNAVNIPINIKITIANNIFCIFANYLSYTYCVTYFNSATFCFRPLIIVVASGSHHPRF